MLIRTGSHSGLLGGQGDFPEDIEGDRSQKVLAGGDGERTPVSEGSSLPLQTTSWSQDTVLAPSKCHIATQQQGHQSSACPKKNLPTSSQAHA